MNKRRIIEDYYDWLVQTIMPDDSTRARYSSLLIYLHRTMFTYTLPMDENRLKNGEALRWDFAYEQAYDYELVDAALDYPVSILEVMVALCRKIEEMMENCTDGCRTEVWFLDMLFSLHLEHCTNRNFDYLYVNKRIDIFLNRLYSKDGDGGLFYVKNSPIDMRDSELWLQANAYMKTLN